MQPTPIEIAPPAESSSFIGRVCELAQIEQALTSSRLVTLTGVGGVGKTRLALEAVSKLRPAFPDGVFVIDLSSLPDPALLPHAIAMAFPLQDQTARPTSDVITDYLADRRSLLLLDTAEPHVQACADLLTSLLTAAPRLRALVTSRQVLGVLGEHVITVLPFTVPDPEQPHGADNSAMRLFAERAAAVDAGFAITPANERSVARLCHRLDGIPLAIEMAAAWLRVLPVEEVEAALDQRFMLLNLTLSSRGSRTAPPRHLTLRQAIGWSHQLCEPLERLMWTRLSCFPATFDLDAAEAVCTDARLPVDAVLDLVSRLVDKSILMSEQHHGSSRYRMLDTVRTYGRHWLRELGDESRLAQRHRDHYLQLAERVEAGWFGPDQRQILDRMTLEHANLQAALDFCITTDGEHRDGLRLAGALWFLWQGGGFLSEGRHWLDRALAADSVPGRARTKALSMNGYLAYSRGEFATAAEFLQASREQALQDGDEAAANDAGSRLGVAMLLAGSDPERALDLVEQSLAYYATVEQIDSQAVQARLALAIAAARLGQLDRAREVAEEVVSICTQRGELSHRSYTHYILALIASGLGRPERARAEIRTALPIMQTLRQLPGIGMTMELLALLCANRGSAETAAVLHGAARQLWQVIGGEALNSPAFNETHVKAEALARDALGDIGYENAVLRGRELDLDAAIAYAVATAEQPAADHDGL